MESEVQAIDYSTVLASAIHDMKNSIGMLLSTIDDATAEAETNNPTLQERFSQIQYQGKRVNDHLIQLLALYRIDQEKYFPHIVEHNIGELIEEIVAVEAPMLSHRKIQLTTDIPDDLYWFVDRELMLGVLTNILNNLYVYTKDKIHIKIMQEDNHLVMQIADNGSGYPEEMLHAPLNGQKKLSFSKGSTGLGLYFASLAADMHSNKGQHGYTAISNDGIDGGGCFNIYIP